MTIKHAEPGEVVNVRPFGIKLKSCATATLIETDQIKVVRIIMKAGKTLAQHKAPGLILVQCLEGKIEFTCCGRSTVLTAGSLLYLEDQELHSVHCIEASSFLLTIVSVNDE